MHYRYLFSVDPSLTCSGWALFDLKDKTLKAVGKITSKPANYGLPERLKDLQKKINNLFTQLSLDENDVLVCESPTTMKDPNAAIKVEQVRSIFETLARNSGIYVPGRINPRSVQYEILGIKGKQIKRILVKDIAVNAVYNLYLESLESLGFLCTKSNLRRHQDIVDAILIGNLAMTKMQNATISGIPIAQIFSTSYPSRTGRILAR